MFGGCGSDTGLLEFAPLAASNCSIKVLRQGGNKEEDAHINLDTDPEQPTPLPPQLKVDFGLDDSALSYSSVSAVDCIRRYSLEHHPQLQTPTAIAKLSIIICCAATTVGRPIEGLSRG